MRFPYNSGILKFALTWPGGSTLSVPSEWRSVETWGEGTVDATVPCHLYNIANYGKLSGKEHLGWDCFKDWVCHAERKNW